MIWENQDIKMIQYIDFITLSVSAFSFILFFVFLNVGIIEIKSIHSFTS